VGREPPHGTLVLFPGALGDAVCLEPAVAWLARTAPVTLHARGAALEVAALFPARPELRSLDAPDVARLFASQDDPEVTRWLARYARVVSFTGAAVPHVAMRLRAAGAVVAPFPRPPLARHATAVMLCAVGAPDDPLPVPRLVVPDPPGRSARTGRPVLALLPGAGAPVKRAPRALLASLAARWAEGGGAVEVLLGPAEESEAADWRPLGEVRSPRTVADLARALCGARAFAGNDSGPSHVAAALGVPGVVLFAATRPADFGPRGAGVVWLRVAEATASALWHAVCGALP